MWHLWAWWVYACVDGCMYVWVVGECIWSVQRDGMVNVCCWCTLCILCELVIYNWFCVWTLHIHVHIGIGLEHMTG